MAEFFAAPPFRRRLHVRIYLALLGSVSLAAILFGLVHLRYMTGVATLGMFAMWLAVALGVGIGAYPIVRRLTRRLERLQTSVDAWGEGRLSTRVAVDGDDEVARLAGSFNLAAERVESLVAAQKTLLANASHELRSPLARIRMAVELLQRDAPAESGEELARNIEELDQLIEEVLLASRLDTLAEAQRQVETLDLTGLVAEECARAGADLSAATVSLDGEPRLLRRMIRNLLENAARHGRGTPVTAELVPDAGTIRLRICDGGPGVPEAEREQIFAPFYRVSGASEAEGGAGLGLSLVRQIAHRHGGEVACLAREEGGCCFEVLLPRSALLGDA
jgi:two-component system OmpR family sensor kinase